MWVLTVSDSDSVLCGYHIWFDKVVRLMDEVETIFTKHFANDDKKKAMKFLRPQQHKESHMVTFFVGNSSLSLNIFSIIWSPHENHCKILPYVVGPKWEIIKH